jgi:dynein assembly factor 1
MEMTKKELKDICKKLKLYSTPFVNDVLYVHYKGFKKIQNLEEYTGLKVIYLEGNGFGEIEGLENQTQLRCLYLQENLIKEIKNLEALTELDSLNLCQNMIKKIENLSGNTKLNTLLLQRNKLTDVSDIENVLECKNIGVLDLSQNFLHDPAILDVLEKLPRLKVLYLKGNPVVKNIKNYRKTVISRLRNLTYLDDRPIFEDERRTANAWAAGGAEGERKERDAIAFEKKEKERKQFEWFGSILEKAREEKRQEDAKKAEEAAAAKAAAEAKAAEEKSVRDEEKIKMAADDTSGSEASSEANSEVTSQSNSEDDYIREEKIASDSDESDVPHLEKVVGDVVIPVVLEKEEKEEKRHSSSDDDYIKEEKRVSSSEVSEEEAEESKSVEITGRVVKQAFADPEAEQTTAFVTQQTAEESELVVENLSDEEGELYEDLPPLEVIENDQVVDVVSVDPLDELD